MLEEADWKLLLGRIKEGRCTPFLGAGACYGVLPLGTQLAADWAKEEGFPLEDCTDLAKVAQFLAVKYDAISPKEKLIQQFKNAAAAPDVNDPYEPHRVLSDLPLPIYITTNYDDFLFNALSRAEYAPGFKKSPIREVCRWNKHVIEKLGGKKKALKSAALQGEVESPLVFHLHGHTGLADSIVLTEDDYLDFMINLARDNALLPYRIQEAFTSTSLLFIGYSLNDWNFRVLFRNVVGYLQKSLLRVHVSVQLVPVKNDATEEQRRNAEVYLNSYFGDLKIRVYWGDAKSFVKELKKRWDEFSKCAENSNGR